MIKKINLSEKFEMFTAHWQPKIIGELNEQYVKLGKIQGEFVMHQHEEEDELFMVIEGQLTMEMEGESIEVNEGEMIIVPKGTMHRPIAENECKILLFEPKSTLNTGDVENGRTVHQPDWI